MVGRDAHSMANRPAREPVGLTQRSEPARRLILLGASNLTRSLGTVLSIASSRWGSPLDVLAALGRGRSYGQLSGFLGRKLPGIVQSGLWRALAQREPLPTSAIVTDIGNDLLYGASAESIAAWVEACVERLQRLDAAVAMTLLPTASLPRIGAARYLFFRTLLVPSCRLRLATIVDRAQALNDLLRRLGETRGISLVEHRDEWYGLDPLHIKLRWAERAWSEILAACRDNNALPQEHSPACLLSWRRRVALQFLRPHEVRLLGVDRVHPQPCACLPDETRISLY